MTLAAETLRAYPELAIFLALGWFLDRPMNTLGLNVFIAIVGISAGRRFIAGLQQVGASLFIWGVVATTAPLVIGIFLGRYVFKFHPALLFAIVAGVSTTTAALGMIHEAARRRWGMASPTQSAIPC
jgi:uncharacterized transporter YbjL